MLFMKFDAESINLRVVLCALQMKFVSACGGLGPATAPSGFPGVPPCTPPESPGTAPNGSRLTGSSRLRAFGDAHLLVLALGCQIGCWLNSFCTQYLNYVLKGYYFFLYSIFVLLNTQIRLTCARYLDPNQECAPNGRGCTGVASGNPTTEHIFYTKKNECKYTIPHKTYV